MNFLTLYDVLMDHLSQTSKQNLDVVSPLLNGYIFEDLVCSQLKSLDLCNA